MEVDERRTGAGGSFEEEEVEEEVEEDVLVDAAGGLELAPLPAPAAARIPVLLRPRHRGKHKEVLPATWGPERAGTGRASDGEEED